jgi:hypothetical protein
MASGDIVLQVNNLAVSEDSSSGLTQKSVLGTETATEVPSSYAGSNGQTTPAATVGPFAINVFRKQNPWTAVTPWPPETLFETGKKYRITITEE